jgi:transcriptional regulator with XRE-family HTH domain
MEQNENKGLEGLRYFRRLRNMTQLELAAIFFDRPIEECTAYHQTQISRYETGKRWPSREILERLASAVGADVSELFEAPSLTARGAEPASEEV